MIWERIECHMRNKFAGYCYKCGLFVAAGTGHFERHNGGWRVQHALHIGPQAITCEMAEILEKDKKTSDGLVFDRSEHR